MTCEIYLLGILQGEWDELIRGRMLDTKMCQWVWILKKITALTSSITIYQNGGVNTSDSNRTREAHASVQRQ